MTAAINAGIGDTFTLGHTRRDHDELRRAGVDPATTQPRERPVGCIACRALTANQAGFCDRHYQRPAVCDRAVPVLDELAGLVGRLDAILYPDAETGPWERLAHARSIIDRMAHVLRTVQP